MRIRQQIGNRLLEHFVQCTHFRFEAECLLFGFAKVLGLLEKANGRFGENS